MAVQQVMNPTSTYEDAGSIPGLTQCVAMNSGVGCRHGSDQSCCGCSLGQQLQLHFDPQPGAWELPYAVSAALKRKKEEEKKRT